MTEHKDSDLLSKRRSRGDYPRLVRPFVLVMLFTALALTMLVIYPFLHAIIFSIILASLVSPGYEFLLSKLKGRQNIASFLAVVATGLIIVLPVSLFVLTVIVETADYLNDINAWIQAGKLRELLQHPHLASVAEWLRQHAGLDQADINLTDSLLQLTRESGTFFFEMGADILGGMVQFVTSFFIMLFMLFYLLRDGGIMLGKLKEYLPMREEQEMRILEKIKIVSRATLLGTFLTAALQGFVGGIGLSLVGIPGLIWGTLMGFASLIPIVGTGLIGIPAVAYLLLVGQWKGAIFLSIWLAVLVGSIDNYIRPLLMHGKAEMSTLYVFLGVLGGLAVFGIPGILYGPLIMGFAAVMLYIYRIEYKEPRIYGSGQESESSQP